ncbi:MAG TPA: glycosyltransferase [Candidatus Methylomirabilis sp.]|nr:glycosyltransferase [Candidatus Methylomirabilis sp.]
MIEPLVSVIMPVYNGEAFLREAVESIRRQPHPRLEIIVVDDGSTDDSASLAESLGPPVRLVRQPHRGLPASHNQGVAVAGGELMAFLDCDDLWTEDKLAIQLAILREHPGIDIVLGHTRRMWMAAGGDGTLTPRLSDPILALSLGAALIRRAVFDTVGRFDEAITHSDDWDWFMRARELGVCAVVHPEVTVLYRRHGGNMTNQVGEGMSSFATMLRKSIARRRAQGKLASLPELPSLEDYRRS